MKKHGSQRPPAIWLSLRRFPFFLEVLLLFAAFAWQGGWPVPDVNEPYYLGKAANFWNPHWCPRDDFFATGDAHTVFYLTFGWLALFLPLSAFAWAGRLLTWAGLAAGWCFFARKMGLSSPAVILSGILFVAFQERMNMAGEWVIGGVEAKGFSYVVVLFALGLLVEGRWNWSIILLGLATSFHVLVGGWSLIALAGIWLCSSGRRPPLKTISLALVVAALLSLPGLIPSLELTWNTPPEILRQAHQIYTFERLAHHLVPAFFRPEDVVRFLLLTLGFLLIIWLWQAGSPPQWQIVQNFVLASLAIALCGWVLSWTILFWPEFAAATLRYYWFRLADVAVPLGVAVWLGLATSGAVSSPQPMRMALGALAVLMTLTHLGGYVGVRLRPMIPRSEWSATMWATWKEDPLAVEDYRQWREVCHWIAHNTPPEARFLTPLGKSTFKWFAGRSEVVIWKEIPQDATSIVSWWEKIKDIYLVEDPFRGRRWVRSVAQLGETRTIELAQKYQVDYILTQKEPPLQLEVAFSPPESNYVVYRPVLVGRAAPRDQPSTLSNP